MVPFPQFACNMLAAIGSLALVERLSDGVDISDVAFCEFSLRTFQEIIVAAFGDAKCPA